MININHAETKKKFAERLKNERFLIKAKKSKICEELGITRQTLANWENPEKLSNTPDLYNLLKLCAHYGCDAGYLLGNYDCRVAKETDIKEYLGLDVRSVIQLRAVARERDDFYKFGGMEKNGFPREELELAFVNYMIHNYRKYMQPLMANLYDAYIRASLEDDKYRDEIREALGFGPKGRNEHRHYSKDHSEPGEDAWFKMKLERLLKNKRVKNREEVADEKRRLYYDAFADDKQQIREWIIQDTMINQVRDFVKKVEEVMKTPQKLDKLKATLNS